MIIHNENPNIIGFAPEDFICFIDNPAPTRNSVSTSSDFELVVTAELNTLGK